MNNEIFINNYIRPNIKDQRIISAFEKVDRKNFINTESQELAYLDHPIPIGYDQTTSQPSLIAYMIEKLDIQGNEKVLEIGTGSGYQTAILANLTHHVFTTEIIKPLLFSAQQRLKSYTTISYKLADEKLGWKEKQPFDKIIVSAAAKVLPMSLVEQLTNTGSMIIPIGKTSQELLLIKRNHEELNFTRLLPVIFVPLQES